MEIDPSSQQKLMNIDANSEKTMRIHAKSATINEHRRQTIEKFNENQFQIIKHQ